MRNREGCLIPFLVLIVLSLLGLGLLVVLSAPWPVIALDVIMLATLFVAGAITTGWKVSMHAAVCGGAAIVLVVTYGPLWWLSLLLVSAVAWSRVHINDHTTAQVAVGSVLGAVVGGGLFAILV